MTTDIQSLADAICAGSRPALARSITLVESTRSDHRLEAEDLIAKILPKTGNAIRVAISGPPGVGKSSFIESLGLYLVSQGKKIAVLAIDPSSPVTGGSILGDKTRMEDLAKSQSCFIRPSPSSGALGGVARHTREALLLCEAAGFDVILIETVGIGQSEIMAASMTDIFVQLHQPYSGDELQGIKKGVMELADLVLITKADGEAVTAAELARADLERAISLTRADSDEKPLVLTCSAHKKTGIDRFWDELNALAGRRSKSGAMAARRKTQTKDWLEQEITAGLLDLLTGQPDYPKRLEATLNRVYTSGEHCGRAAKKLIHDLLKPTH